MVETKGRFRGARFHTTSEYANLGAGAGEETVFEPGTDPAVIRAYAARHGRRANIQGDRITAAIDY